VPSAPQASAKADDPGYGPTLPELLRPRLGALAGWQRALVALGAAAIVAAGIALLIRHEAATRSYHQGVADARARGLTTIPFNFDYSRSMKLTRPPGAYVRIERSRNGVPLGRFTVAGLEIGRQRGFVSGFMPIVATRYEHDAARSFKGFRLAFEGRARVNEVEGYQFAFTARLERPGHRARLLLGRVVMLPEPYDAEDPGKPYPNGGIPTRGILITMLATTLDHVSAATRVGDEGILQRPFRSFRFG
jgi:hypothetical protein